MVNYFTMATLMLIVSVHVALSDCVKYRCKPSDQTWASNTCGFYNATEAITYMKMTCDIGQTCYTQDSRNYACNNTSIPYTIYPGDKCSNIRPHQANYVPQCSNDPSCTGDKICPGPANGEQCVDPFRNCIPKHYCSMESSKCEPQKPAGASCESDSECQMNLGCYIDQPATKGVCKEYYSYAPGMNITAFIYCLLYTSPSPRDS